MIFARVDSSIGKTATLKLEGPADLVASLREQFLTLVQSVSFR
jgi:hypothetical protein